LELALLHGLEQPLQFLIKVLADIERPVLIVLLFVVFLNDFVELLLLCAQEVHEILIRVHPVGLSLIPLENLDLQLITL
jgi:hypothetical protein